MFRRIFWALCAALINLGCSLEKSSTTQRGTGHVQSLPSKNSLKDVSEQTNLLAGQIVRVQGYLTGLGPIMILVESKASNLETSPALIVTDDALGTRILRDTPSLELGEYVQSLGCLNSYVEITGKIGQIRRGNYFGIVEIKSIKLLGEDSFSGEGRTCYPPLSG